MAARPCSELGRVWPVAGEAGLLELGETLGGDAESADNRDWLVSLLGVGPGPTRLGQPTPPLLPFTPTGECPWPELVNSYASIKTRHHLPSSQRPVPSSKLCLSLRHCGQS